MSRSKVNPYEPPVLEEIGFRLEEVGRYGRRQILDADGAHHECSRHCNLYRTAYRMDLWLHPALAAEMEMGANGDLCESRVRNKT